MKKPKLKRCPFCGSKVSVCFIEARIRWDFDCPTCNGGDSDPLLVVSVYTETEEYARIVWNRRARRRKG